MTELVHGTHSTYNNHKCRCPLCKLANTTYWKSTRHAKKANKECRNCSRKVCKKSKTFCEFHRLMHNEQSARHNRGRKSKMRVFTVKFSGVWPVGASAVVVADDQYEAERMLRTEWRMLGNVNDPNPEIAEVTTTVKHVTIINNGDY